MTSTLTGPIGAAISDADADAGKHKLNGGENDLRACLQGHGLFALRGWRERGTMPRGHGAHLRSFADLRN